MRIEVKSMVVMEMDTMEMATRLFWIYIDSIEIHYPEHNIVC